MLTGGRLTGEDAYAYAKFARVALGTNDIDFRARPHSAEEADFLAARVAGRGLGVTYADLERADRRPAARASSPRRSAGSCSCGCARRPRAGTKVRVFAVAPFTTRGLAKLAGTLVRAAPGRRGRGRSSALAPRRRRWPSTPAA